MFKNSDNREAAWKFVEYLSKPEVQAKFYDVAADLPSNQSAWDLPQLAKDAKAEAVRRAASRTPRRRPSSPSGRSSRPRSTTKLDTAFDLR